MTMTDIRQISKTLACFANVMSKFLCDHKISDNLCFKSRTSDEILILYFKQILRLRNICKMCMHYRLRKSETFFFYFSCKIALSPHTMLQVIPQ